MKKLNRYTPSPAMVVALVALVAALGGSAYAAVKVGTKQIKAGAVTAGKIKNGAVTEGKIANGAVSGAKLNLPTIGTVPSAAHASTADTATKANEAKTAESAKTADSAKTAESAKTSDHAATATTADTATNFSRYLTSGLRRASVGQEIPLLTVGPFSFKGVCSTAGAKTVAQVFVETTEAKSNLYADGQSNTERYNSNFEPGESLQVDNGAESEGPEAAFYSPYYNSINLESADGAFVLSGEANSAVNTFGADCSFEVHGTNNA